MQKWQPTPEQSAQYERDGYLILRGLLARDAAMEVRGVIKNIILTPEPDRVAEADPMDPMGDSSEAKAARFRKLNQIGFTAPVLWNSVYTNPDLLAVARHFLGDDLLLKFSSVFLKPARTGSATPWHQDNGLWRDGEIRPFNLWMALDPATIVNGCLQFIPGSHKTEIVPHLLYQGGIHGELPHERVQEMVERYGVHHVELQPGDAVIWHSNLWHYSPPNTSDFGRIGIAGVWSSPEIARTNGRFRSYHWVMKNGQPCTVFPPETWVSPAEPIPLEPFPLAPTMMESRATSGAT